MRVQPDDLVITLGGRPAPGVLNVAKARDTIEHIRDHVAAAGQGVIVHPFPHGPVPVLDRELRFYLSSGERLALRVAPNWSTLSLETMDDDDDGEVGGAAQLRAQVDAVLTAQAPTIDQIFDQHHEDPPQLPPPGTWQEELDYLYEAFDLWFVNEPDRRGFWHNLFVHGGHP